ncbi:MAG: aldo/keto reductase [Pseudomonadota bacterium]
MEKPLDRRTFLRLSALTGVAAGVPLGAMADNLAAAPNSAPTNAAGVRKYVTLGRTGLKIADISFGSSRLRTGEEHLVHHALARGINYFDTAESYTGGASETVLGNALRGKRDQVIIATKSSAGPSTTASAIMQELEDSLTRLQTDYVDVYFNHAVNDVDRLKNPAWFEFVERAKQQGKIRFTGMSGHGGNLVDCVNYAVDRDMFDVMLLAHNFGQDPAFYERFTRSFDFVASQPKLPQAMARAKAKGVGIVAMKVLRGAKLNDMRPFEQDGHTYAQAAFKWALGLEFTDAAVISMTSTDLIDEYLGASGDTQLTEVDYRLLEQYARLTDMTYCRHACNDCEGSCPFNVPIADVLRTRMYAVDYGDLEFARTEYAMLGAAASPCLSCDGSPCRDACSHGIDIARLCGPTGIMLG